MTSNIETIAYRNHYGAVETNGLPAGGQQELLDSLTGEVYWSNVLTKTEPPVAERVGRGVYRPLPGVKVVPR